MNDFFDAPILNNPYNYPDRHWELDDDGQPTLDVLNKRRPAKFITPIPKPRKRKQGESQGRLNLDEGKGLSDERQQYDPNSIINDLRGHVAAWRRLPNPSDWKVTAETARLLQHWRHHEFSGIRPFFCQVEAVETIIWLTEVAPNTKAGKDFLTYLENANAEANPGLIRIALKLATGAGKTTVMAMIIAWQTINAARHPTSKRFTRGFLVVTPGITIRDRLRVLQPNDPDSYYRSRELVPSDMLLELGKAKIVITNYHAFKMRERFEGTAGTKKLLEGHGDALPTTETEGQMLQRVMPDLMGMKRVMVLNDEAHHCYREKPEDPEEQNLKGDDKKEADKNSEAARLWISGLEIVARKLAINNVIDLSATPFFLSGSGYVEGTLFPWTVSDFSLMDAIECGIVKLPRVPVVDNIPTEEMPIFRNLWEHVGKQMPKKGRGKGKSYDPLALPVKLISALDALYGHYEKTFQWWQEEGITVPPCFIIVCNNTSTSKLVYDFISGFHQEAEDGTLHYQAGHLPLFRNFDEHSRPLARPRTLLIDSEQLESGDALDKNFRDMASDEIDRFRREIVERTGSRDQAENISDQDLLREVMNTVGKEGRLGESVRCVVSVSMLTEGWDANTVTHVLGIRAFGTQLLCEQVVGRALRRQSYELNEDSGLFDVEYADIFGIPFDFTAKPTIAKPQKPRQTVHVQAVSPERDHLEIRFPRVQGYRIALPEEHLKPVFTDDSVLELTTELLGATDTRNAGIVGEGVDLNVKHLENMRDTTVVYQLTRHLLYTKWRDPDQVPKMYLFGKLKRITQMWLDNYLVCKDRTYPAQILYPDLAERACERIMAAIAQQQSSERPIQAILDPYNPVGSTMQVSFNTSKSLRWQTDPRKSHINWAVCDSGWESQFCQVIEAHERVKAYVKNHNLGFEIPYKSGMTPRRYIPDFILQVDDGREDLLNLIVEIKGYRNENVKDKHNTTTTYWIPGVNNLGSYGRWDFAEFTEIVDIADAFDRKLTELTRRQ